MHGVADGLVEGANAPSHFRRHGAAAAASTAAAAGMTSNVTHDTRLVHRIYEAYGNDAEM